jgi:hypothetical protein
MRMKRSLVMATAISAADAFGRARQYAACRRPHVEQEAIFAHRNRLGIEQRE